MSVEMEIPKVLWLKNHMPADLFARCKFYDLADALTHLATGNETRSYCSTVCKQGFVPVGVDGSVKGWQEDFYHAIGLGDLVEDNFKRIGGVHGVVSPFLFLLIKSRGPQLTKGDPTEWHLQECRRAGGNTFCEGGRAVGTSFWNRGR